MFARIVASTRHTRRARAVRDLARLAGVGVLCWSASQAPLQAQAKLPFFAGEELRFRVRVGSVGTIGSGTMRIEGPVDVRGQQALHLRFDVNTRVGPIRVVDNTSSWVDSRTLASLRFHKHERHPLSSHDERVELFPGERRWTDDSGRSGRSPTGDPLDELSFLYFIRTLPLEPGAEYRFDRHFETDRNPVTVKVIGREEVTTALGRFETILVEMRVRDPRRFKGEGVIRINLSNDACRLPVRIRSTMPVAGETTLLLESHTHPNHHRLALQP